MDIKDLGIFKFAKDFFGDRFSFPFSDLHYQMIRLLFKLIDPSKEFIMQRQCYMLVHREAAKTTIGSFLLPIFLGYLKGRKLYIHKDHLEWSTDYCIENSKFMINDKIIEVPIKEHFILITSQTKVRAEGFVSSIKGTFEQRNDMARVFGEKDPRIIQGTDNDSRRKAHKIWRINSFITKDETIYMAIGAGQHTRGLNINGRRPSLIIVDDLYSQDNTKTEESRTKLNYWFESELLNSADSRQGKALVLGTMVHPDTIFKDMRRSEDWFGIERPIISMDELHQLIKSNSTKNGFQCPTIEKCNQIDKTLKTLSWKDFKGSYFILKKYEQQLQKRRLDWFYQEFMNEPLAPETKMVSPDSFYETDIRFRILDNRQIVEFEHDGRGWIGQANLYLGLDPASSIANTSDDTAITIAGFARCYPRVEGYDVDGMNRSMPNGKIFPIILHIEGGKYSTHNYEQMKGMCEALLKLDRIYKLEYINIEASGQQQHIVRDARNYFREHRRTTRIWDEFSQGNKSERILSILLPIVQQYKQFICQKSDYIKLLYNQLLTVGIADHDDYPDALAIALKNVVIPANEFIATINETLTKEKPSRMKVLKEQFGEDYWMYM